MKEKKIEEIKNIAENEIDEIQKRLNEKIDADLEVSKIEITKTFNMKDTLEEAENYVKFYLKEEIDEKIEYIRSKNQQFLLERFDELYENILEIIKENLEKKGGKLSFINLRIRKVLKNIRKEENEIEKMKKELFFKILHYSNEEVRKKWREERKEKFDSNEKNSREKDSFEETSFINFVTSINSKFFDIKKLEESKQKEIRELEELLKKKREQLEKTRREIKTEYMKNITENITAYFQEEGENLKNVYFKNIIEKNKKEVIEMIEKKRG